MSTATLPPAQEFRKDQPESAAGMPSSRGASASPGRKTLIVKAWRQPNPGAAGTYEEFHLSYRPNLNVISVLMDIRETPVNARGQKTTPVAWESACLEEVCGACSMNINGVPRQACSALVDRIVPNEGDVLVLEPFRKFPVIRDLVVDRSSMFENLKRVKAWVPIDGTYALGEGPRIAEEVQEKLYKLSECMTCGCCVESCPQVNDHSDFIGPAAISQVRLFNSHPTGKMHQAARLNALMGPGGIQACGKAQNCVRVCPKGIPLTDSIFEMNRAVTLHALKQFFTS